MHKFTKNQTSMSTFRCLVKQNKIFQKPKNFRSKSNCLTLVKSWLVRLLTWTKISLLNYLMR